MLLSNWTKKFKEISFSHNQGCHDSKTFSLDLNVCFSFREYLPSDKHQQPFFGLVLDNLLYENGKWTK